MSPRHPDDRLEAADRHPGQPIEIRDDRPESADDLAEVDEIAGPVDEALRQALQIGLDQSDRGESTPWDLQEFLTQAHKKHA